MLKTTEARGAFWQPITGSVEPGEGFFEGACREAHEETGLEFLGPPEDTGYEFEFVSRFGPTRERSFALRVQGLPDPRLDPKEHNAFQWISPEGALKLLRFPSNIEGLTRSYRLLFKKELAEK